MASVLSLIPVAGVVREHDAQAQGRRGKKKPPPPPPPAPATAAPTAAAPAAPPPKGPQDIDADAAPKSKPDLGPVQAGQPSADAAAANRLFEQGKYAQSAPALSRVVRGETSDDEGNKQIASFNLAASLYNLGFYQASYAIFSDISTHPNHLRFNETLLWLATLATKLPEPADIVERVGKYSSDQVARFNNAQQRNLYWQLNYLLGRFKYHNRRFDEAISLFEKVDKKSKYYLQAQFFNGISYVQLKQSVPAVKSFQRVAQAIEDGAEGQDIDDRDRLHDLAFLSMARTYYSSSIKLDESNAPRINGEKLSLAVKYWNRIDVASEYWLDGLFEEAWAYFMAGDYPRALGNIHTIESPYFPNSFYPEADILRAQIYFATCQYDSATTIVARFKKKYEPIQKELQGLVGRFGGEGQEPQAFQFYQDLKAGRAQVSAQTKPLLDIALSDRQLLKHRDYVVRVLGDEERRYEKSPYKGTPLGNDIKDALDLAKDVAVKNAGRLVRERYQRNLDELNEHLRNGAKVLIDITSGERTRLEAQAESGKFTKEDAKVFGVVKPDEEHVIWPFDGEYWRDELGFYRQVVTSQCGRLDKR